MATDQIILWGAELVADLDAGVFAGQAPQTAMFDASANPATGTITVRYSAAGSRMSKSYPPGSQGGRFPVMVGAEIAALGWKQGETVVATFTAPATLTIKK